MPLNQKPLESQAPPIAEQGDRLAPILSLSQARQRREERNSRAKEPPGRPPDEPADRQTQTLGDAVRQGRLPKADLFAMVRLGIVTDNVALLPCADPHRSHNASDWEQRFCRDQDRAPVNANSPATPSAPIGPKINDRGPSQSPRSAESALPPPSRVGCPLMAQVATSGTAPACVEALRLRAQIPRWRPGRGFELEPVNQDDPVVVNDLRPCVLLSRALYRHVLLPLSGHDL